MNVSDVIVGYLAAAGIRHVFGYPGDPSVEFLESSRRAGLDFVLGSREGTAGLMAAAYGQLTSRPGVCLSTLGPGSTNLVNAVASAWLDRTPMLAISGQIATRREAAVTHQVVDHGLLFAPITKWTTAVRPGTVATVLRRALRTAMADRPGPVHLTTPADVVGAEATDAGIALPPMRATPPGRVATQATAQTIARATMQTRAQAPMQALPESGRSALANARGRPRGPQVFAADGVGDPLDRIRASRRPIVVAGLSAVWNDAGAAVQRLAETLGCPVVVSPMAKGVVAETHPLYAGTLDMACNAFVWEFLRGADLLLPVGFDAVELIKPWSLSVPTIHVDSVPNVEQIVRADTEIVGDIGSILDGIADEVAASSAGVGERWSHAELAEHRARLRELYASARVPGRLNPSDVVDVVRAAMPADAIATSDVGSHKLLVGQGWTTHSPRGLLMSNGLSSMGFSLPAAIVAKLLYPGRPVVCFTGDGGLAMVQGELRVAATLKLAPVVVVFCDGSLNRIELKQRARNYPSWGTRFERSDVGMLARAMGCDGVDVDSVRALESALAAPRSSDRPLVIGATIDPSQYAAQF